MPNPALQNLERELTHLNFERARMQDLISTHFTPFHRDDILSSIRHNERLRAEAVNDISEYQMRSCGFGNQHEQRAFRQLVYKTGETLKTIEASLAWDRQRLRQYDDRDRDARDALRRIDTRITDISRNLAAAQYYQS